MNNYHEPFDMSQLEREFELAMGHVHGDTSYENLDRELESMLEGDEEEYEYDEDTEYEYDEDNVEYEYDEDDSGVEFEVDDYTRSFYADRLFELSQREFENEYEMATEIDGVLDEMQREFFTKWAKGVFRKARNVATSAKQFIDEHPGLKAALNKGLNMAANAVAPGIGPMALQGLQAVMAPTLEGVRNRARPVLNKAIQTIRGQGVSAAGNLLSKFGIDAANTGKLNLDGLKNVVGSIQKSFEFAADNIHGNIDDPIEAERLASRAFEVGLKHGMSASGRRPKGTGKGVYHVELTRRPDEEIKKIVIVVRGNS